MKAYIQSIKEIIAKQLDYISLSDKHSSKVLIRLENFSELEIYLKTCEIFKEFCKNSNINFIGKLSKERVKIAKNEEVLRKLKENMWIEEEETLTMWRNKETKEKTLVLLMGSELVQDKGGLHDFYVINPEIIDNKIGKKYHKIFERDLFNKHICGKNDIINNFFNIFFKYVPKNIFKLSKILDEIEKENLSEINNLDDIFKIFCSRFYKDWEIPSLNLDMKSLKIINSGKKIILLEKLFKFNERKDFENLSKAKFEKYESSINEYLLKNDVKLNFFSNKNEFKTEIINYIKGGKLKNIKEKLFKENFILINNILNIKTPIVSSSKKTKIIKLKGDPIFIILKSVLDYIKDIENTMNVEKDLIILFDIKEIILKENICDDESMKKSWFNISRYLGGILNYISEEECFKFKNGVKINLKFFNEDEYINKDIFNKENYKKLIDRKIIKKLGDDNKYSKIKFILKFDNLNEDYEKEYEYLFLNSDIWTQSFSFFDDYLEQNKDLFSLPLFISNNLEKLSFVNDEEEFSNQFQNLDINYSKNLLTDYFLKNIECKNDFFNLAEKFKDVVDEIDENGFYNLIKTKEKNKIIEFIRIYNELAIWLRENENNKQTVNYFINQFLILENDEKFNEIGTIKNALSLSLHPAMLEKIFDKNRFIIKGIREYINLMENLYDEKFSKKNNENLIEKLNNLSKITSSIDILPKTSTGEYIKLISCHGLYGYYRNESLQDAEEKIITFSNMNSKDILINEDIDDIGFSEKSVFSTIIYRTLKEYTGLFKYSTDNLELLFINPYSLQHIVSGIEEFLKDSKIKEIIDVGINIKITIMMRSFNITGENYLSNWVNEVIRDLGIKLEICFTNFLEEKELKKELNEMSSDNIYDLIFLGNILEEKNVVFDEGDNYFDSLYDIKYPVLYKPVINDEKIRRIEISQPQFKASTLHSQLCYKISNDIQQGCYENKILYKELEFNSERREILEKIHNRSRWIVCIDKGIDRRILKQLTNPNKIISFSSGEGEFGDFNLTISTTNFNLIEIKKRIKIKLRELFSFVDDIELLTEKIIDYSGKIDGLSLIKALNLEDKQIHKYLTDMIIFNYIKIEEDEIIINLDNYKHWFILGNKYPDYLKLKLIEKDNGFYEIEATVIECKLGKENIQEIQLGEEQLIEGFKQLEENFTQNKNKTQMKYWNLQLYKVIIYSLMETQYLDKDKVKKLHRILEGKYNIKWNGNIYSFLTNRSFGEVKVESKNNLIDIQIKEVPKNILLQNILGYQKEEWSESDIKKEKILNIERKDKEYILDKEKENIEVAESEMKNLVSIISNDQLSDDISLEEEYADKQLLKMLENLRIRNLDVSVFDRGYEIGPNFIRLKIKPEGKTSVTSIKSKYDDIKIWLSLNETPYIFADAGYISIDIPRRKSSTIYLGNILEKYKDKLIYDRDKLEFMIGIDEEYNPAIINMQDSNNPHMLIAGQSGSGKSVLLNCIIMNIMLNYTPEDVRMILIDPKCVEMSLYSESPFLLKDIVIDLNIAIETLKELTVEMDERYKKFAELKVKDLKGFNRKSQEQLYKIFVVFDEFGDYMAQDKKIAQEIEKTIIRLTQKGRAAGIHMIISTQSPKADIITTTIKNNLPSRIALRVTDMTASQVILDENGAENLYGKGDLLFKSAEFKTPKRLRSPYIDEENQEILLEELNKKYKR